MANNKKSKLTLLVDGNWLLMSRLFVMNKRYGGQDEMLSELNLIMLRSINVVLRQFPQIDNVMFLSDGGSWRNYLSIPKIEGLYSTDNDDVIEYKGNREKSDDIDWDVIFNSYDDFRQLLQMNGINVYHEPGIEGDDWAWYWSQQLNSEGTNVIIWTKDHDLMQLVKTNADKCFTVWWNKDNGLYTEDIDEEELNFLFNPVFSENETLFNDICSKSSNVTRINPYSVIVDKIIRGDLGDNIQPIFYRTCKPDKNGNIKSDKKYRVSAKDIDINLNINDDNAVKEYLKKLLNSKSYKDRVTKSFDDIFEHFHYNTKLVCLNKSVYPNDVLDIFSNYKYYNCCKDLSSVLSDLNASKNNLSNILNTI